MYRKGCIEVLNEIVDDGDGKALRNVLGINVLLKVTQLLGQRCDLVLLGARLLKG